VKDTEQLPEKAKGERVVAPLAIEERKKTSSDRKKAEAKEREGSRDEEEGKH